MEVSHRGNDYADSCIRNAQSQFYMASGRPATSFDELDISFDSFPTSVVDMVTSMLPICAPDARSDGSKALILNNCSDSVQSIIGFLDGPYALNGFSVSSHYPSYSSGWHPEEGKLYCVGGEAFCHQLMKGTYVNTYNGFGYYAM